MRLLEKLLRHLSKVVDEADSRLSLQGIRDILNVDGTFVEEMVENIVGVHGCLARLLTSEDQVNPLM